MSATDPSALALFWLAVIGLAILAYVVLDGFDLGVGIAFWRHQRRGAAG